MLTGRNRYRTHAGIPHGSTNNLTSKLAFYLQWKEGLTISGSDNVTTWADQSENERTATNATEDEKAVITADLGLDFESGDGNHYDLDSQVAISGEEHFVIWLVCNIESVGSNMTILSLNNTNHFLEFKGGADAIRIKLDSTTTQVDPKDGAQNDFAAGSKFLLTIEREAGGTGNINLWKNGAVLGQDSQAANPGEGEFLSLGVRNSDRYFDGIIYDVAFVESHGATAAHIERINAYLCAKHGL